jgi:hypothetical protein
MATQTQRADRAHWLIRFYAAESKFNPYLVLSELLCDIMAWCRREGEDFSDIALRAFQMTASEHLEARLQDQDC